MKTRNNFCLVIITLVLFISACRDVTIKTIVNRDGTFTRVVTVTGDSSDVFNPVLPYPVDATWAEEYVRDTTGEGKFTLTYTKTFRNSDELNQEVRNDTSWMRNVRREVMVSKRFNFFYSYLTFRQVYKATNPFTFLDYKDYLTEEDLLWLAGLKSLESPADSSRSDEAEEKADSFMVVSITSEIESILVNGIKKLKLDALPPADVYSYHDSLVKKVDSWEILEYEDPNQIIDSYLNWSGNTAFSSLKDIQPPLLQQFGAKIKSIDTLINIEGYHEVVEMPGLITATNSIMLKGSQVSWDFEAMSTVFKDYEMFAESRVVNYWAFIVSGVVLLLLVILLVIKAFFIPVDRHRRSG